MKQVLKKGIVLMVMLGIFLSPVSAGIKIDDKQNLLVGIEVNEAMASSLTEVFKTSTLKIDSVNSNSAIFSGEIVVSSDKDGCSGCRNTDGVTNNIAIYKNISTETKDPGAGIFFVVQKESKEIARLPFSGQKGLGNSFDQTKTNNPFLRNTLDFVKLDPQTTYSVHIEIPGNRTWALITNYAPFKSAPVSFTTTAYSPNDPTQTNYNPNTGSTAYGAGSFSLGCSIISTTPNIIGCIAQIFYSFWEVSAWIARLAGSFLDFFVYYSTNSSSYRNDFVEQAWAAVRDIANIFFIIALLYVAIKTILGLNVTDNKKLIGAVVVVALIINFSLFTTKLVIDGSNILAKVFYNNITSVDQKNKILGAEAGGQKSISIGIINKFDPQEIITTPQEYASGPGTFIFITILALVITLYTAYIFFSVALVFVSRTISLWLSMVFSPIAFVSYTLPFDIPGLGHKEWWSELLKNAFVAPFFIFFLYIIILFTGFIKKVAIYSDTSDTIQHLMTVAVPFIIIAIILKKAKEKAIGFSGELGQEVIKFGAMAGGLALGAATGGAAMAGRTLIGGGGGYLANKLAGGAEKMGATRWGGKLGFNKVGSGLRNASDFVRKGSWDVRGIKVAGSTLGSITGLKVGEAEKGGWAEMKKRQVEKRQKRADELEKRGTGKEKKAVEEAEIKLKEATLPVKLDLEKANKQIDKARIDLNDAKNGGDLAEILAAKRDLDDAKRRKDIIRGAEYKDAVGNVIPEVAGGLASLEKVVHQKKQELDVASEEITTAYAKKISGGVSKGWNFVRRLGGYSFAGADEAARKIRTGTKLDSGEKPH